MSDPALDGATPPIGIADTQRQRQSASSWSRRTWMGVVSLLAIHSILLANLGRLYAPTRDEPAHLAAGYRVWTSGRFDLYPVNPPLVKVLATWPLLFFRPRLAPAHISDAPGDRPEFMVGRLFLDTNPDWPTFLILARWSCIPLSLLGAVVAFQWARESFGTVSGWIALTLWCFDPNLLSNGCLITPDLGASSIGLLAGYWFWRWLKQPDWGGGLRAGLGLGLAWLSKTTLLFLWPIWAIVWVIDRALSRQSTTKWKAEGSQLVVMCVVAIYILNLGYGFDGTGQTVGEYQFVSQALNGRVSETRGVGNRFQGTWLEKIPVPLPRDFLRGVDLQKRDFDMRRWSYLDGEWRHGGWPAFYLWAILWKSPSGYLVLGAWSLLLATRWWGNPNSSRTVQLCGMTVVVLLGVVSLEQGFTIYLRYVLPALPYAIVLMSVTGLALDRQWPVASDTAAREGAVHAIPVVGAGSCWRPKGTVVLLAVTLTTNIVSLASSYPYTFSYFNELSGGPARGYLRLLDANLDWGQDLYFVREWVKQHPAARPLKVSLDPMIQPDMIGLNLSFTPHWQSHSPPPTAADLEGWHLVSVNNLCSEDNRLEPLRALVPVDRIGYSTMVYKIDKATATKLAGISKVSPSGERKGLKK